jgi:hypothetical protein
MLLSLRALATRSTGHDAAYMVIAPASGARPSSFGGRSAE